MIDLQHLSDEQVLQAARTAWDDLCEATENERESEWHECCFAACVVLSNEMSRRGISLHTTH